MKGVRHDTRLAAALERMLASYGYPKDPVLFRATARAAKRAKKALAAYYRDVRLGRTRG